MGADALLACRGIEFVVEGGPSAAGYGYSWSLG